MSNGEVSSPLNYPASSSPPRSSSFQHHHPSSNPPTSYSNGRVPATSISYDTENIKKKKKKQQ